MPKLQAHQFGFLLHDVFFEWQLLSMDVHLEFRFVSHVCSNMAMC